MPLSLCFSSRVSKSSSLVILIFFSLACSASLGLWRNPLILSFLHWSFSFSWAFVCFLLISLEKMVAPTFFSFSSGGRNTWCGHVQRDLNLIELFRLAKCYNIGWLLLCWIYAEMKNYVLLIFRWSISALYYFPSSSSYCASCNLERWQSCSLVLLCLEPSETVL